MIEWSEQLRIGAWSVKHSRRDSWSWFPAKSLLKESGLIRKAITVIVAQEVAVSKEHEWWFQS